MKKTDPVLRRGDVLYHAEHGACLVRKVEKAEGLPGGGLCYHLVTKEKNATASQFFVPVNAAEDSGFHRPYTVKEGHKVLDYLKKGGQAKTMSASEQSKLISELVRENTLWACARVISIYSHEEEGVRAQGKYRVLVRAARGLIRELAYIFDVSPKSSAGKIRKTLMSGRKTNSWVLETLSHMSDEVCE